MRAEVVDQLISIRAVTRSDLILLDKLKGARKMSTKNIEKKHMHITIRGFIFNKQCIHNNWIQNIN
jgi:hypothetical protein